MWYVYMLECENNTLYTGIAKEPTKRFQKHLSGKGARYTRLHKPIRIIYLEEALNRSEALKREYAIKKLSRKQKLQLQNQNTQNNYKGV